MTERRDMKQDSYVPSVAPAPQESSMAGQASREVAPPKWMPIAAEALYAANSRVHWSDAEIMAAAQAIKRAFRVSDGDGNREDRDSGLSGEGMPARPTPNPPPSGDIGELVERASRQAYEQSEWGHKQPWERNPWARKAWIACMSDVLATSLQSQAAEIERLKPYEEELRKVADDLGEPDDPFAAWESVAALKSRIAELEKELAEAREDAEGEQTNAAVFLGRAIRAESRLSHAVKVIEPFAKMSFTGSVYEAMNGSQAVLFCHADGSQVTLAHFQAARAFLSTGGDNG